MGLLICDIIEESLISYTIISIWSWDIVMGDYIVLFLFDPSIWFCIRFAQFVFALFCLVVICYLFVMAGEWDDFFWSISVKLNGKNYSYWSYVMIFFSKGQNNVGLYYWYSTQTYKWKWWKICITVRCLGSKQFENYCFD